MTATSASFSIPIRVYYGDTDAAGVVYYANYLRFMEQARTEWLRSLGVDQAQLRQESNLVFAIAKATVEYRRPAFLDDELIVTAEPGKYGRASFEFTQHVFRGEELLTRGCVKVACVDTQSIRSAPIPEAIREILLNSPS